MKQKIIETIVESVLILTVVMFGIGFGAKLYNDAYEQGVKYTELDYEINELQENLDELLVEIENLN